MADPTMVWLRERLVPRSEAVIPADDWGFLYGDTLFETLRVVGAKPLAWRQHMARLERSARLLQHSLPWSRDSLADALSQTLAANSLLDAAARITVTRGHNPSGLRLRDCTNPLLLITVRPYAGPKAGELERGVKLRSVRVPNREAWARYRTKSGNYLDFLLALDTAAEKLADEAILVDRDGRVLEGARSNLFVVTRQLVLTPPVRLGILPGTVRSLVMRWARALEIPVAARSLSLRSLLRADEAFMTNSLWGIMPVSSVDGCTLTKPHPGPTTRRIIERQERWIERVVARR